MGRLEGKVVLITGGGSGMGRLASVLFAREGAKVVVAEIAESPGRETEAEIRGAGGAARFVRTDVANEADVAAAEIAEGPGREPEAEIRGAGGAARFVRTDVAKEADVAAAVRAGEAAFGR